MKEQHQATAPIPVRIAVLTVSDSRDEQSDTSGQLLIDRLTGAGHALAERRIVRDEVDAISAAVQAWCDDPAVDAVIATGGTGPTGRDVTADAFEALYEKDLRGFGELFRMLSYQEIGTSTIHSRATAGLRRGTLLFALPGSRGACRLAWDEILAQQLDAGHRPCNLVALMPRLTEQ